MITIKQAEKDDVKDVLRLLDDFRSVAMKIINPDNTEVFTAAKLHGAPLFTEVINNPTTGALFIAFDKENAIGIISIYKIPQIRKGVYRAEIEEIYVDPAYHGKGVGAMLMNRAEEWARTNNITSIQLISNFHLKRAHSFYKKMGFVETSKSFEKKLQ